MRNIKFNVGGEKYVCMIYPFLTQNSYQILLESSHNILALFHKRMFLKHDRTR